jgi:diguanylate cyclase (GGDEF)-like protein/PAS domain S-box-containing protein
MNAPADLFAIRRPMSTASDLLAINERLNLALESTRQVAFDWFIPEDKLYFSKELAESCQGLPIDTSKTWSSSQLPAIMHDDDKPIFRTHLHAALKGSNDADGAVYRVELRLKDAARGWRWVDIGGKIVERDGNGRAVRMVGTFSDIDERKQTEKKVARLHDLYAALSQTNQAIVRINERDALFQEICRIAVEHGHFHMAWIGLVDHATQQVIPVASYGNSLHVLQEVAVSIDASKPAGCGVIGTAIRENRPNICNDFFSAPQLEFWWEAAAQSGFQATASFPFQQDGKVLGALNLYATEKDFFDESLINLLEEMTRDIAFAINNYEREAQREEMKNALVESEKLKSAILTAALDCIISINHEDEIISFNEAAEQTFGHPSKDVLGKKLADIIVPPEWRERHQQGLARFLETGNSTILNRRIELNAMHADGSFFPIELAIVPIRVHGKPIFTAFIRDISELKRSQALLKESAMRYRQLVELSPEAIFVHRQDKFVLVNQAAVRMLGAQDANELIGKNVLDFIHPDYHAISRERARKLHTGISSTPFVEQVWIRVDGTRLHTEVATSNVVYDDSSAVQAVVRDNTVRKRAEEVQLGQNRILNMVATGAELPEVLKQIALFIEAQSDRGLCSIMLLNPDGGTLSNGISPSLPNSYSSAIDGLPVAPASGSCGTAIFRAEPVIVTDIATDPLWAKSRALALRHGLKACSSWPIFGKNRKMLGTVALYFREAMAPTVRDLQLFSICTKLAGIAIESRASEERIRYLAHYDGLTCLPNRFLFKEFLDLALRNAQRHRKKFAVFFLDLDKFKDINDTFGHEAGDQVLREIAARLRASLRQTDKIARMGGDEFYVLIEDLDDGCYAAEIAQKLLEEASRPVYIDQHECQLSVSIGIGIYPDDGSNGQALLKNADNAMYRAKNLGKNGYQFYSSSKESEESETI